MANGPRFCCLHLPPSNRIVRLLCVTVLTSWTIHRDWETGLQ